jgi:hypothetical protein
MTGLLHVTSVTFAVVAHALIAPAIFAAIAGHYFAARGAREPVATASAFVAIIALLDLTVVAALLGNGFAMSGSLLGFWLPLVLIFGVTAVIGTISSMGPLRTHPAAAS